MRHMEQLPAVWYSTVRVTGGMTASKWHHLSHSYSQTSSGLQAEAQHRLYLHLQSDSLLAQLSCWDFILHFHFFHFTVCWTHLTAYDTLTSVCWSVRRFVDQQLFSTKNAEIWWILHHSKVSTYTCIVNTSGVWTKQDIRRRHLSCWPND